MLKYYPEERATAQDMLSHYWLNMPDNFDYWMNDREYERMMMIKKNQKKEKTMKAAADVLESDNELNMADEEDNDDLIFNEEEEDTDFENEEVINIQNFNNSFAAYGQHVNLAALDRPNPQFHKLKH